MRIAMISYHTCPLASLEGKETGGMNVYVLELARALSALGHTIDIYTRSHEQDDATVTDVDKNLHVIHLPAGPQKQLPKQSLVRYIPEFTKAVTLYIHRNDFHYDVLHAHYYQSGEVALGLHMPFYMSFHTLGLMKNLVARGPGERETSHRIRSEFILMKKSRHIVASSESDKKYMQYLYNVPPEKITVITPGIDSALFHPIDKTFARLHIKADPLHKIVLFVGRVEPLKGIDTLVYAIKILKSMYPGQTVCLWIVGGDTSQDTRVWSRTHRQLSLLQKTLSLETSIRFVGRQKQSELPYYYNAADVVVIPSHYESFGMSVLEAIGCDVPVITTNVTGISGILSDEYSHFITTVNNPLLLASQIQKVLEHIHPSRRTILNLSNYSWVHVAERMRSVYKFDKIE